ncbi:MAG TPA: hypothetical protein VD966_04950, partial [Pyrinomonadaceae bacterium]|nr:hypothetical protein [Pyrinomonadaceae bacterium]
DRVAVSNVLAGEARYDLTLERTGGQQRINVLRRGAAQPGGSGTGGAVRLIVAPAFPLDAQVRGVTVNGRAAKFKLVRSGDVQRAEVNIDDAAANTQVVFTYAEGTDVYVETERLVPGAASTGLRILRSRAEANGLRLTLEGLGGRSYQLRMRTPRRPGSTSGLTLKAIDGGDHQLIITFDGTPGAYSRREVLIPLLAK